MNLPHIVPIETNHAAAVAELWMRCTAEVAEHEPIYTPAIALAELTELLHAEFRDGQRFGWVALAGEQVAGYLTCRLEAENPLFVPRHYLYLIDLDVDPGFRRQGLSRRLMAHAEAYACAQGLSRMELAVAAGDPRARRAWEAQGFKEHMILMHRDVLP